MAAVDTPQQNGLHPDLQSRSIPSTPPAVWGATDKGQKREGNEDAIFPHSGSDTFPFEPGPHNMAHRGKLLIVADGVGGARAGREASHWAVRVAAERYYDQASPDLGADLRTAIEMANASLHQYLQTVGTQEAGCTMVAAVIHADTLYVANVGDSRAYLLRNGQITQLTKDHTLTQKKIDRGLIQPEQAELDPSRHVLTRSIGARPSVQVDLFPSLQLAQGDTLLLCSDGLTDMVSDAEITRLTNNGSPKLAAQRLIAAANRNGGVDNVSVVIARIGGTHPPATTGLLDPILLMTRGQKTALAVGTVLVTAALCAMAALGWWMNDWQKTTQTPPAATTPTAVPATPTADPSLTAPSSTKMAPANTEAPAGQPTSTPAPTFTPTSTPPPPTPTHAPTSTPPPSPTATGSGDAEAPVPSQMRL